MATKDITHWSAVSLVDNVPLRSPPLDRNRSRERTSLIEEHCEYQYELGQTAFMIVFHNASITVSEQPSLQETLDGAMNDYDRWGQFGMPSSLESVITLQNKRTHHP